MTGAVLRALGGWLLLAAVLAGLFWAVPRGPHARACRSHAVHGPAGPHQVMTCGRVP